MKNFTEHTTNTMPKDLTEDTLVVYKTTSVSTPVSHVHHPKRAGDLNWNDSDQYMGAILEYAVYTPKKVYSARDTNYDEYVDSAPLLGAHS